jgi:hypothetical protein
MTPPRPLFEAPVRPLVPGIPSLETAPAPAAPSEAPAPKPTPIPERVRARLPAPGAWGSQAPHDARLDLAAREDAAEFFRRAAEPAEDVAAPEPIHPQDTQALIAGMAEEIALVVAEQRAAEAAAKEAEHKEAHLLEQPTLVYQPGTREAGSGRGGWAGLAAAAAVGVLLIGWSFADDGTPAAAAPTAAVSTPSPAAAPSRPPVVPASAPPEAPPPEPPPPEPPPEPAPTGIDTDALALEDPVEPAPEAAPPAPSSGKSGPRPRGKTSKASPGPSPKPTEKTSSSPTKPAAKPAAASASDLLAQARKANAAGDAGRAYSLASQAHAKGAGSPAAEVMVLAACKQRNASKAKTALSKVRLLARRDLKQRCKSLGVDL